MQKLHHFSDELSQMIAVGAVSQNRALIWLKNDGPGEVLIRWQQANSQQKGECQVSIHNPDNDWTASIWIDGLNSDKDFSFQVSDKKTGRPLGLGEGKFHTAPEEGSFSTPFSFAFFSCHQPFDDKGFWHPESEQMIKAARQSLELMNTKRIFMAGDQMYTDMPASLSLFNSDYIQSLPKIQAKDILDLATDKVRSMFHQRYRAFFSHPEWVRIQAEYPAYLIWDDHEIIDNWGSMLEHQQDKWKNYGEGARLAFADYQASRSMELSNPLQKSFHYQLEYGPAAVFTPDLRSERTGGPKGRVLSNIQLQALEDFLENNHKKEVIILVLSVPIMQLPKTLTQVASLAIPSNEDFSDRWSSHGHIEDRDKVLKLLRDNIHKNPHQRVIVLSGDIHIGCAHEIKIQGTNRPIYQFISSPLTHKTSWLTETASKLLMATNQHFKSEDGEVKGSIERLSADGEFRTNPYKGMNIGFVEVTPTEDKTPCRVQLHLYGHKQGVPHCVYRSPFL